MEFVRMSLSNPEASLTFNPSFNILRAHVSYAIFVLICSDCTCEFSITAFPHSEMTHSPFISFFPPLLYSSWPVAVAVAHMKLDVGQGPQWLCQQQHG